MKNKLVTIDEAITHIKDGMTVMVGGFLSKGTPELIMDAIVSNGTKDLTIIANDGGTPGTGIAKLIAAGLVKKLIATHIGMNPQVGQLMNEGTLEVELVPQGTMAERIRAQGAGLGGVLTKTGLGTEVEAGKQIITVENEAYLLESPLRADIALIKGSIADDMGNISYQGTTQNFNPVMATAASLVIAEVDELVPAGKLVAEHVITPGIFVNYIVGGKNHVG